ncbi:MAG TPA: DUF5335 family protein [Bryobacteraceae bacterium]|nr:DUF5335 family protein [Bryobacteraceae bacterium]
MPGLLVDSSGDDAYTKSVKGLSLTKEGRRIEMGMQEIQRNELRSALDQFSRTHQGWLTNLEDSGGTQGRAEIRDLPLVGISVDDRDGENQVVVMVGDRPDDHLTHIVSKPTRARITDSSGGQEDTVEIEAEGGNRVMVRCRAKAASKDAGR